MLLVSPEAHSDTVWNKPNIAPYLTKEELKKPQIVLAKIGEALDIVVVQNLVPKLEGARLKEMGAKLLLSNERPEDCRRSVIPVGMQITMMSSGADKYIPNAIAGPWAGMPGANNGAWMCRVSVPSRNQEVYLVIPDVCANISLIVMQNGVCIKNPYACDGDCATYAKEFVS